RPAAVTITSRGWYPFRHTFTDDGGSLAVEFQIFDSSGTLVPGADWTIHSGDLMSGVGGTALGWFPNQEINDLAIDDSRLDEPAGSQQSFGACAAGIDPGTKTITLLSDCTTDH